MANFTRAKGAAANARRRVFANAEEEADLVVLRGRDQAVIGTPEAWEPRAVSASSVQVDIYEDDTLDMAALSVGGSFAYGTPDAMKLFKITEHDWPKLASVRKHKITGAVVGPYAPSVSDAALLAAEDGSPLATEAGEDLEWAA